MPKIQLFEPSFADAIRAIEQASSIAPSKRKHWVCSLRQIAKLLDRPPESIAARWIAVALQVNRLHHAPSGLTWKTLANHKSNAKAALLWFRNENRLPLRGAPLRPAWQSLRSRLVDRSRLAKLSGLCRFCSFKGIEPDAVGEAVVDDYMSYRLETTALAADNKTRRAIARAWNWSSTQIEGWPQHRLIEPPLKGREGLHWESFPRPLRALIEGHLTALTKPRRGAREQRLRPCRPSTLRTRRVELISYVKKAVSLGTPIDELTSFASLLNPDLVERVLNQQWERDGSVPKTYTIDLAKKLFVIARSEKCLDQSGIARLDDMRANLEQYRREGMTPKNLNLIRHVVSGEVWRRVVNCPKGLMIQARSWKDQSPLKAAITAQIAVAVAIETVAPVRASNLAAIRLGENLIKPGGPASPYWLVFPDYDVKNRLDLEFPLDAYVTAIIDEYVHDFRPTLLRGSNDEALFPGTTGGPKDAHHFGNQITARVEKATGLRITLHQFRHAAAAIYLKHRPGDYETVRRILGHRSVRTTTRFYCSLETTHATRLFGKIVQQHLRFDP